MHPINTSLIVFGCLIASALLGMLLGKFLPDSHLDPGARETIKEARAVITGVAALTLGLLVASAKASFDAKATDIKTSAAKFIMLDRTLAKLGPEAAAARLEIREIARDGVSRIDGFSAEKLVSERQNKTKRLDGLQDAVLAIAPQDDKQSWLKSTALTLTQDITQARWSVYHNLESSLQPAFLAMLTFWLASILLSLGLVAPINWSTVTALTLASTSLAGAVFLTLEMDQPFGGLIRISSAPFRATLDQIGPAALPTTRPAAPPAAAPAVRPAQTKPQAVSPPARP